MPKQPWAAPSKGEAIEVLWVYYKTWWWHKCVKIWGKVRRYTVGLYILGWNSGEWLCCDCLAQKERKYANTQHLQKGKKKKSQLKHLIHDVIKVACFRWSCLHCSNWQRCDDSVRQKKRSLCGTFTSVAATNIQVLWCNPFYPQCLNIVCSDKCNCITF